MFSPELVVSHLLKNFGSCDLERTPSRKEQKLIDSFTAILREAAYDDLVVDSEEDTVVEEDEADPLWEGDSEDEEPAATTTKGSLLFGDVEVTKEEVEKAIQFYRSSRRGSRPLSCMKTYFRFVRSEFHLHKLRQIEREGKMRASRLIALRTLTDMLKEEVMSKLGSGVTLHDCDIRRMALQINSDTSLVEDFKAGHKWIQSFKRKCGIVSRHFTTFRSRKSFLNRERIATEAENFVQLVRKEMERWPLDVICNADQSGFLKELHTSRSLALRGLKQVERVVQSVSATTHSFTVLPCLFADGHLGQKLFVVMQEVSVEFPAKGYFCARNLEVRASRSHIMNKQLMLDWLKSCVAAPESPSAMLLIVDTWTSFKDHDAINSALPPHKQLKVLNIPPGATRLIQP